MSALASPTPMHVVDGFAGAVGHTPLIRLKRASAATGCEILGKAEFMQPGGSVKDRAGLGIIEDAEARGQLTPGQPGIVVEGTAGNTGIGLTLVANARGYKAIIVVPSTARGGTVFWKSSDCGDTSVHAMCNSAGRLCTELKCCASMALIITTLG